MSSKLWMMTVLAAILPGVLLMDSGQRTDSLAAPPVDVLSQSFSVAAGGALTAAGVHPADILGVGGAPLIPCVNLGLLCNDFNSGAPDEIAGLSFGVDFTERALPPIQFSVDNASRGRAGSAVRAEATCSPAQAHADVFESAFNGNNVQDLDGDGVACAGNAGYGLSLSESSQADTLDALDRDPCQTVDLDCDGTPDAPIYFTLAPGSPTLTMLNATAADILAGGADFVPTVWVAGVDFGLRAGDVIDAFCLLEDGDGSYGQTDRVIFSLARGSPTLTIQGASPADLFLPAPPRVAIPAVALGLEATDNIDALSCTQVVTRLDLYMPIISRR